MNTNDSKTILIHKEGAEGTFKIDALSGQVLREHSTAGDQSVLQDLPEWADNAIVNANLQERRKFYISRIGEAAFEALGTPDAINFEDLGWVAVDPEGDLVEIDANHSWRLENLAGILGIDTASENFDKTLEGATHEALVSETYRTDPSTEEALGDFTGATFEDNKKLAVNG